MNDYSDREMRLMQERDEAIVRAEREDELNRDARNILAVELDRIDGEHSSSLVHCAQRAAELLKRARELVGRSPLGYHNGRLMVVRGTTDDDVVEWLKDLEDDLGAYDAGREV